MKATAEALSPAKMRALSRRWATVNGAALSLLHAEDSSNA